jgi:hypothetical protein
MLRVLRPGGALWLQTQTPHQHMEGFWWTPIIPRAAAVLAARFAGPPELAAQLQEAGFAAVASEVPPETLVSAPFYLDPHGPFEETFRNGDSTWSLATPSELEAGLKWWRTVVDAGGAEAYLEEREAVRARVGQTTAVIATKA